MIWFCAGFAVALAPLALAGSMPLMLVLIAAAGFFVAPWAATSAALVGRLAPPGAMTEAYTWEMTAVVTGFALGGVLSGVLVESAGVSEALAAAAALAAGLHVIAWARAGNVGGGREPPTAAAVRAREREERGRRRDHRRRSRRERPADAGQGSRADVGHVAGHAGRHPCVLLLRGLRSTPAPSATSRAPNRRPM